MERLLARIAQEFPDVTWTSARIEDEGRDRLAVILDNSMVFRVPTAEEQRGCFGDKIALLELVASCTSIRISTAKWMRKEGQHDRQAKILGARGNGRGHGIGCSGKAEDYGDSAANPTELPCDCGRRLYPQRFAGLWRGKRCAELDRWMEAQGDPGALLDTAEAFDAARKRSHTYGTEPSP